MIPVYVPHHPSEMIYSKFDKPELLLYPHVETSVSDMKGISCEATLLSLESRHASHLSIVQLSDARRAQAM